MWLYRGTIANGNGVIIVKTVCSRAFDATAPSSAESRFHQG